MLEKIREKLLAFINSGKDAPLLAGFSVGFYMMLFYYSKNFALANSPEQILFFTGYFILVPVITLYVIYSIMGLQKLQPYRKNFLFVGMIVFFTFYFLQLNNYSLPKWIVIAGVALAACIASVWIQKYYKLLIILLFLMSVFNLKPLARVALAVITASDEWKKMPDDIEQVVFKQKPNIYFIQPDGYTNPDNLKNSIHNFDNTVFETYLKEKGFTLYEDFRSNYFSTLLSNSSMFSMKHHYLQKDVDLYKARKIIVTDNPVLRILKRNGYKTTFLSEKPYLVMNRPKMGYDYSNIDYDSVPYFRDGWDVNWNILRELNMQIKKNGTTGNFYFLEKFTPGHINVFKQYSMGVEAEKNKYLQKLEEANVWLREVISSIEEHDPGALIIIAADHGGYAGYGYTLQSLVKTDNEELVASIYGAMLAIKWNDKASEYDTNLQSGVNLFRTVFSFLSKEKKYLKFQEDNSSFIRMREPEGMYRYINDEGHVVFEKYN